MNRKEIYDAIGERVLAALNEGTVPWAKPWKSLTPRNLISKKPYRGINTILLGLSKFNSPYWLTFKQAKSLGGHVKRGERGTQIIFWKFFNKDEDEEDEKNSYAVCRMYTVFNLEQTEGVNESRIPVIRQNEDDPIEAAEAAVEAWEGKPVIKVTLAGMRAFYAPTEDSVNVPSLAQFTGAGEYYQTLFHELAHSTGHPERLNRFEVGARPSKESYSKEELVAEISSAFIMGILGIDYNVRNTEAYVKGWASFVKDNKEEVVKSASQAQKVVDMILGVE